MAERYLFAVQKLAILEPLFGKDFAERFNQTHGARALNALTLSLLLDIVRDSHAFLLDRDARASSLANIWRMMSGTRSRAAFRVEWSKPTPTRFSWGNEALDAKARAAVEREFAEADQGKKERRFDELCAQVDAELPNVLEGELAERIRTARNKAIAHYELHVIDDVPKPFMPGDAGLKWQDPREFMAQVEPVLFRVVLLATNSAYDVEGFKRVHSKSAADFWDRLRGMEGE